MSPAGKCLVGGADSDRRWEGLEDIGACVQCRACALVSWGSSGLEFPVEVMSLWEQLIPHWPPRTVFTAPARPQSGLLGGQRGRKIAVQSKRDCRALRLVFRAVQSWGCATLQGGDLARGAISILGWHLPCLHVLGTGLTCSGCGERPCCPQKRRCLRAERGLLQRTLAPGIRSCSPKALHVSPVSSILPHAQPAGPCGIKCEPAVFVDGFL